MGTPLGIIGSSGSGGGGGGATNPFTGLGITWTHGYWTSGPEFLALGLGNGASISSWPDEVGTADLAQATGSRQPTLVSSDTNLGNQPTVHFDGVDDYLTVTFASLAQPNEIAIVARLIANSGNDFLFDGAGGSREIIYANSSGSWVYDAGASVGGGTVNTTKHLFRAVFNGASSNLRIDEVSILSGNPGATALAGATLAAAPDPSNYGQWNIAFVGIADSALTAQNRTDLHTWAQTVYGTA